MVFVAKTNFFDEGESYAYLWEFRLQLGIILVQEISHSRLSSRVYDLTSTDSWHEFPPFGQILSPIMLAIGYLQDIFGYFWLCWSSLWFVTTHFGYRT